MADTKKKKANASPKKGAKSKKKKKQSSPLAGKAIAVLAGITIGLCASLGFTNIMASRKADSSTQAITKIPAPKEEKEEKKPSQNIMGESAFTSIPEKKTETKRETEVKKEVSPEKKVTEPAPQIASSVEKPKPDKKIEEVSHKFNIPPAKNGATLLFVIDDAGMNVTNVKKYTALPFPLTIAVLPKLPQTSQSARAIIEGKKELILHQPMQAKNLKINPGLGAITPSMDSYQIQKTILDNLAELGPGVKGFNNHEGSLITEDKLKMIFIIDIANQKGLYFLDSRTSSESQAKQAALELDSNIIERNAPFLDNAVTREEMIKEIYKGLEVANKVGYAVIIGHVDKSVNILPPLLKEMYPELSRMGYKFATPSQLRLN